MKTGDGSGDRVAVLEGLAEGERVVTAANFFVDSQAQLAGGASVQYSGALDVKRRREVRAVINRIIDFSLDNRFAVLGLTLLLAAAGIHAIRTNPVDAIPDISETQIIVFADWPGRSPQEVEDQVTYPDGREPPGPRRREGRPVVSAFGFSMINVIFEDGTDLYFARTRILERLSLVGSLPAEGRDAGARSGRLGGGPGLLVHGRGRRARTSARCARSRTGTSATSSHSVPGVAEVASIGGFVRQYQIDVDPNRLAAYDLTIRDVIEAVQMSNNNVGGKVLEKGGSRVHRPRPRPDPRRVRRREDRRDGSERHAGLRLEPRPRHARPGVSTGRSREGRARRSSAAS